MKIGIDFGGVIIKASEGEPFNAQNGINLEVDNALFIIEKLLNGNEVWIISKASKRVQNFTREWLSLVNFYSRTKFHPQNLIFCEKRSEKAKICEQLKLDCFIDDNTEIIESLENIVDQRIHFTNDSI